MSDRDEIHNALNHIDPHERELWLKIGAALKDELGADGFAIWDNWSQRAENYQPRAARDVWKSLKPGFVRINSLFHEARQNGYVPSKPYTPPSPAEQARRAAEAEQRRQQEQRNTEAAQAKSRQTAQRLWARNQAAKANHPYLLAKGISNPDIISQIKQSRYQGKDNLLIPVMQNNEIVSMQFIDPNGGKRFLSGGALRGSHTVVGNPDQMAAGVVLAEGFATAASIYQATGKPVVVTFNAGNLPVVAGRLAQTLPPDIAVTIAADNDASGTGIQKAQEAAALLGERARVVMPAFTPAQVAQYQATHGAVDADGKPKLPSDFNDLQQLAGTAAVQAQMAATAAREPQNLAQQLAQLKLPEDVVIRTETLPSGREIARITLVDYDNELMIDKLDTGTNPAPEGGYLASFQGLSLAQSHLPGLITEMTARLRVAKEREQAQAAPAQPEKTVVEDKAAAWPKSERSAWGDFPPVLRNGDLGTLKAEPEYQAAKSGDVVQAAVLVERLVNDDAVRQLQNLLAGRQPAIVPVYAIEATGHNQIPLAMAHEFARRLDLPVDTSIQQANKVSRTGAGIDHRLAFQPSFTGDVEPGREYLIMDDTLSVGSTIAALKGHIENRGGKVLGAAVMTAHEGALNIVIKPAMMEAIRHKHGEGMDQYWKEEFGYGIDKLTQGEAGHLRKAPDVEHIRDRIAAARDAAKLGMAATELSLSKGEPVRTEPAAVNPTQKAARTAASSLSEPPPPVTDSPATAANQAAVSFSEDGMIMNPADNRIFNGREFVAELKQALQSSDYWDPGTYMKHDGSYLRADRRNENMSLTINVRNNNQSVEVMLMQSSGNELKEHVFSIDGHRTPEELLVDLHEQIQSWKGLTQAPNSIEYDDSRRPDVPPLQETPAAATVYGQPAAPVAEPETEPNPPPAGKAVDRDADAPPQPDTAPAEPATLPVTDLKYKAPPDGIAHRYICANGQYLAAENGTTVVFTDSGKKISTAKTDAQTVKDMLEVAKAKGWDSIKLSGSREFKSMMYVAAESQGIRTRGYAPTPADLALVEKLRAEQSLNSIEAAMPKPAHSTAPQPAGSTASVVNQASAPKADTRPESPPAMTAGERIIAHGAAPYQNQPDKQMSYFVRLEQDGRERTVWGAGLPEALHQSGADVGDRIALRNLGHQPVEIEVPVHDEAGKVVGHEHKSVTRNVWQMDVVASRDGITAAADQDRSRTAEPEPEQPDRTALSAADRMVARSQMPDIGQINVSARADQDIDVPLQSIGADSIPPTVAKSAAELKTAALETSYAAAKDHYMVKADKLSKSAKAKLAFYERSTLDVIRAVTGDTRTEALRNFYENTAAKMHGSKLDLPHPMQIPSPEQSATRDAGQPKTQTVQTAESAPRGQDEPEMER